MPVFNGEKFIDEAISSILNQSYSNLELIIVNDGSADESENIILRHKKNDLRIKYFKNKKNIGISRTLNKAISRANGKYIARMDCDDVSMSKRIEKEVAVLERNNEIGICGSWATAVNEFGNCLFLMRSPTGLILKYNYWKPSPFVSSSVMVRRKLLKFDYFDKDLITAEDYDLWVRLLKRNIGYNISIPLIKYRIHESSISNRMSQNCEEMSLKSFSKNFGVEHINIELFRSLICQEFKISTFKRFHYLWNIRKKLNYPIRFLIIDNLYYGIRRFIYSFNPGLNPYK